MVKKKVHRNEQIVQYNDAFTWFIWIQAIGSSKFKLLLKGVILIKYSIVAAGL